MRRELFYLPRSFPLAPWDQVKLISQQHLLVAAYFDKKWTQKVLADEELGHFAKRHLFNPCFEPIIRDRIPTKYAFRMDWILKELADEMSSFSMDPSDLKPEHVVYSKGESEDRKKSNAYIHINSQAFNELNISLLNKVVEEFPPIQVVGKKPEAWLRAWVSLPKRPAKLFSFQTETPAETVLSDLEKIKMRLEEIGPARVDGFKMVYLRLKHNTQVTKKPLFKYYSFKDCPDYKYSHIVGKGPFDWKTLPRI